MESKIADWEQLFSEICYSYSSTHKPKIIRYDRSFYKDTIYGAKFNKLTIYSDGQYEYKGVWEHYDPKLWWKVEMLVKLFEKNTTMDILYGN